MTTGKEKKVKGKKKEERAPHPMWPPPEMKHHSYFSTVSHDSFWSLVSCSLTIRSYLATESLTSSTAGSPKCPARNHLIYSITSGEKNIFLSESHFASFIDFQTKLRCLQVSGKKKARGSSSQLQSIWLKKRVNSTFYSVIVYLWHILPH
jgi:hypothetical protein